MREHPHRVLLGFILILALAVVAFQLFVVKQLLERHKRLEAYQSLEFVKTRILSHMELRHIVKELPPYLKDLAWLTDELQSLPLVTGVFVSDGTERLLLNTFPEGVLPEDAKTLFRECLKGYELASVYFVCDTLSVDANLSLFLLVGLNTAFFKELFGKTRDFVLLFVAAVCVSTVIVGAYVERLVKKERDLRKRLEVSEKLALAGRMSAALAHEIRNPLNSISMWLQLVEEEGEVRKELLQIIKDEVRKIVALTEDLLTLPKDLRLSFKRVRVAELAEFLEERLRLKAAALGLEFEFEVSVGENAQLRVDEAWLLRALENLVKNSREAEASKVRVRVRETAEEVVFEVSDDGKGVSEREKDKIFEPFFSTKRGGGGLGLFVVKKVIEAHGGRIELRAGAEGGTTFLLSVPKA